LRFPPVVSGLCALLGFYAKYDGNSVQTFRLKPIGSLNMEPSGCSETSELNYHPALG
jgi:hypothetical protein